MGAYLRGRWWWYRRMIEGHEYYRPLRIRKGQENLLSGRIAQEDAKIVAEHFGLPVPAASRTTTLSEFIKTYEKRKTGKGSLDHDLARFKLALPVIGDSRLMDYTLDNFQALETKLLDDDYEPSTVNRYMQAFHHLFEIAIREKAVLANPLADYEYFVEGGKERRALTDDEAKTLLTSLRRVRDAAIKGPRKMLVHEILYDLCRVGLYTGARLNELVGLRRAEVDGDVIRLKVGRVKFRRRGRQAPFKEKPIFLPPEAVAIVAAQPAVDEYVFPMRRRDPRVIAKAIYQLNKLNALGIAGFSFHVLRHTWVSAANEVTDGPTVRDMAGHTDYRTTLRYSHSGEPKKRTVATKLGTRFRSLDVSD